jgi:hypothetical protein
MLWFPLQLISETFLIMSRMERYVIKMFNNILYIFLTVHLRIILVGNQLDAQFLL